VIGEQEIVQSTNSGSSWFLGYSPGTYNNSVACGADGVNLVVAGAADELFTSPDFGATWASASPSPNSWFGAASSSDSGVLVGATDGGGVYIARTVIPPSLSLKFASGTLRISWALPSSGFALQQSANLTLTNWFDVTNVPILDLTNLQYRVTIPTSATNRFYRLRSL
jgi:hypothetical protein